MKVLILMTEPKIVRNLYRGHLAWLVEKGIDLHVCTSPGDDVSWIENQGCTVHQIAIERKPRIFADILSLYRIVKLLRTEKFDVLHYSTPKASLLGAIAAAIARVPKIIYTVRGRAYENFRGFKRYVFELMERFTCSKADICVFISQELCRSFVAKGQVKLSQAIVIGKGSSNGFDTQYYRPPSSVEKASHRAKFGIPADVKVLCYVGRVTEEKGILEFLKIAEMLVRSNKVVHFLIAGSDEGGSHNVQSVSENLGKNLLYLDWLEDIRSVYWASDLLLFPSQREGFGNACVEAALCGLPTVAFDVIGCRESVCDKVSGFLVDLGDIEELYYKVESVLDGHAETQAIPTAGRNWAASNFDQRKIWNSLHNLYLGQSID